MKYEFENCKIYDKSWPFTSFDTVVLKIHQRNILQNMFFPNDTTDS